MENIHNAPTTATVPNTPATIQNIHNALASHGEHT